MRILSSTVDRQTRIAGIVGSVLVASVLTGGAVAAQDATPAPEQGTIQVVGRDGANGAPVVISSGTVQAMPAGMAGGCGGMVTVTMGADGTQHIEEGGPTGDCGPFTIADPFSQSFGPILGAPGHAGFGHAGFGPDGFGTVSVMAEPGRVVAVTSVDGDTVGLVTDDGWSRDLDTANVVITLDKDTLTAADLAVGDKVHVVQVQNANDTWTITGLEVVLPEVMGTVSDVTADGFTVTEIDGTTTVVKVSDTTKWPQPMLGAPATGLDALKDGDIVAARGKLAEDGTMAAHSVLLQASMSTFSFGDPGMPLPAPLPAPETPEASAAP